MHAALGMSTTPVVMTRSAFSPSPSPFRAQSSPPSVSAASHHLTTTRSSQRQRRRLITTASSATSDVNDDDEDDTPQKEEEEQHRRRRSRSGVGVSIGRRTLLAGTTAGVAAGAVSFDDITISNEGGRRCFCGGCAYAMAPLIDIPQDKRSEFDPQRNAQQDTLFAKGMNSGMTGYEQAVADRKKMLFSQLFSRLPTTADEATVVEVGMGTFPNAPYYFDPAVSGSQNYSTTRALDLVGIDPNDSMESYARDNLAKAESAAAAGASSSSPGAAASSLRIVHGVAEALPLPSNSADAIVCTLTLCSVSDPAAAVAEIKRVLKPGAPFLFIEHVLSEDDPGLAKQQLRFNGLQIAMADGCHLDRKTLDVVKAAGFKSVEAERFTLPGFGLISSQVAGIAVA